MVFGGRTLTYEQLNRRANQVAHRLRAHGAGPETLVAVHAERSLELVAGLLGVLKAGALADFITVDISGPHNQPATRAVCCLTSSARGSDVRHVVVNGEHIVADGRSTRIDEEKAIADALQATKTVIEKAGITDLVQEWKNPEHHYSRKADT